MGDRLSEVLDLIEINAVVSGGFSARGPWFSQAEIGGAVKFSAVVAGDAKLFTDRMTEPITLHAGDVVIMHGQQWLELSGGRGDEDPQEVVPSFPMRATISHVPGESDVMVGGHIDLNPVGRALLREALPPVAHIWAGSDSLRASVYRLFGEVGEDRPGAAFAVRQHAQLLLLEAFRAYVDQAVLPAGWLRLVTDDRLAHAVDLMHGEPARAWHLPELARAVTMSRTMFVDHFRAVAGLTPLAYLTRWRMRLAQRALQDDDVTVGELARELGYSSDGAFSNAFKREVGESPLRYRTRVRSEDRRAAQPMKPADLSQSRATALGF